MTHTSEWNVRLHLFEEDGRTVARAVLETGEHTDTIAGQGLARCNPEDVDVPEIGEELAASRAMVELAQRLMRVADRDLQGVGAGSPVPPERSWQGWPDASS